MATLRKALIVFVPVIVWVVLFGLGCQKKEDKEKAQKGPAAPIGPHVEESASLDKKQMPPDMGGEYPKEMMEALQKMQPEKAALPRVKKDHVPVSVSPDVRSKWKAVVIEVANKQTNEQKDYVVDINKSFVIPNTKIKIDVLAFLPDFSMSPKGITSLSNEPKNPAVKVVIHEDDKKIFESWLFQKLPTIHPFEHKVYGIKLKGQKPA
ncbi:MAG: DUF2155 domain-containing protein, partial [Deltaproteobacteria bacterium]|nr:DUF2155 domain-containing protein [Deltaproteobacteria bacterium]MBW1794659.1 DUF2155 domain-containing protein [Deltaproteobacteria bacterium]